MRRVDKGAWPEDGNGQQKIFRPYRKAKSDLIERLGAYCSYCEREKDGLAVEHVVPKKHAPTLEENWTNFLLACRNCNSIKRDKNVSRAGYTWPDDDEDWRPFDYFPDGIVKVQDDLSGPNRQKAQNLFGLLGLGRRPGNDLEMKDIRWRERREAWNAAEEAYASLASEATDVNNVLKLAKHTGFWSVWMTVFSDRPDVCERLRKEFPGTR